MDKYLLLFYTEGKPHDNGMHLERITMEVKKHLSENFTDVFCFNKRDLKKLPGGDKICNEYNHISSSAFSSRVANKIGFYDFKPFLIKHVLDKIPENSLLFWQDVNFEKYPQYWATDWKGFEKYLTHDIYVSPESWGHKIKNNLSRSFLKQFFNEDEIEMLLECSNFYAGKVLMRNTPFTRSFISEWNDLCHNKELMLMFDNEPHEDFMFNCCDQNIMTALLYKYIKEGKLPLNYPTFCFENRTWNNEHKQEFTNYIKPSFVSS